MVAALFPGVRALARGAVLAHDGRIGVAWTIEAGSVVLLPIQAAASRRRRSDVAIDDVVDLVAMGFGGSQRVVRTAKPYRVARPGSLLPIGRAPAALLARIEEALAREARVRAIEDGDLERPPRKQSVRL